VVISDPGMTTACCVPQTPGTRTPLAAVFQCFVASVQGTGAGYCCKAAMR
jgi:hypothetical protein